MAEKESKLLPFASFGIVKPASYAYARGFRFEYQLHDARELEFFGLLIFSSHEEVNAKVAEEITSRIKDTIKYQQELLEGNKISVTNEDFFEQCLQKVNNELGIFLRDIDQSLSLKDWSVLLGMVTPSPTPLKKELYLSRFGDVTGWLLHSAQLDTKKLISIFDTPDILSSEVIPQKFFSNIIASQISANDQLFFCSPNLLNHVSLSEIKNVLSTLSAQSALKHLENQVNFSPSDRVVAALTIRLSPYPLLEKDDVQKPYTGAETSMTNLIHTQSETEKLLGNGVGISIGRITESISGAFSSAVSRAKQADSEIIPTSSSARQNTPISRTISIVMTTTGKTIAVIQKTVIYLAKRAPKPKASQMDVAAKNQAITRVNILGKQISDTLAPLTNRFKFYKSKNNASNIKRLLMHPGFIAVVVLVIVSGFGLHTLRTNQKEAQERLAFAESTIQEVQTNLDQIDSYLIVGRESDAITLMQSSLEKLTLIEVEDFQEESTRLTEQLESRQRILRKETLIETPEVIASDLPTLLGSSPKSLLLAETEILILGENPRSYINLGKPTEVASITTDISSYTGAIAPNKDQVVFLSENAISQVTLSTGEALGATPNVRESLISAATYNNRLYTLAPSVNQLYRSNTAPNYSVFSPWISDEAPNLANAQDLAIDGSIYVLFPDRIDLYNSGRLARPNLALDPLDPPLANAQQLWLTADSNKIYILESERIIEFEKSGKFRQQYIIPGKTLKDILVDSQQRIGYILTDNEVLKINL